jgi:beta-lactamase class D
MKKRIFPDSTHTIALILVGTQVSVLRSESEHLVEVGTYVPPQFNS